MTSSPCKGHQVHCHHPLVQPSSCRVALEVAGAAVQLQQEDVRLRGCFPLTALCIPDCHPESVTLKHHRPVRKDRERSGTGFTRPSLVSGHMKGGGQGCTPCWLLCFSHQLLHTLRFPRQPVLPLSPRPPCGSPSLQTTPSPLLCPHPPWPAWPNITTGQEGHLIPSMAVPGVSPPAGQRRSLTESKPHAKTSTPSSPLGNRVSKWTVTYSRTEITYFYILVSPVPGDTGV